MGTLFSPLSLCCPPCLRLRTHLSTPISYPHISLTTSKSNRFKGKTVVFGGNLSDIPNESQFLDENGAVDDMDGYLNYLSLEYDSVWDTKPSWCQPWTITLTGVLAITGSWLILHSVVVTAIVLLLICTWWICLKVYTDMIAERRKRVTNGVEDTFGTRKSQ
ncbi:PROTEIN putative-RELATED [Salix purpurea]|uniref:PROTEIN putative-RELATED n=1 Tax=Salix purpurea TaxID=77065 RepID=A0A9Q0WVB6_SALPP|nr:PROTEIN putative-RELATED [Salix purpurea]